MRERTVEAYLKFRVEQTHGIIRKAQWTGRAGCPDRWCGWPAHQRTAWVELKGKGGELSPHQVREIQRLLECGERVEVLSSFGEIDAFIEAITSRPAYDAQRHADMHAGL